MDEYFVKQAKLVLRMLPFLSAYPHFALKGGTALNFFIRSFPRLSVDIDLTYLPIADRETSLTAISESLQRLTTDVIAKYPDFTIIPRNLQGKTVALRVSDQNVVIKIEPNLVIRGSVFGVEKLNVVAAAEQELQLFVSALCLSKADLYGGKICAALDRQHPRDLFDVKLLLDSDGITTDIRQAFVVYLASHSRPMAELLQPNPQDISSTFESEFRGMTRDAVILDDLLAARAKLIQILNEQLSNEERRFLLSMKKGEPDWRLMPVKGIESLPAIQWKLHNIHRMPKNKHDVAVEKLTRVLGL